MWTIQLCPICSSTHSDPCLCLILATCEPAGLVLCCKPVIVLGQLPKDVLKARLTHARTHAHTNTRTHCSRIPPPSRWGTGQERTACVPSRRPKFHDFPRVPILSQVIYSVVVRGALMKTHEEHRGTPCLLSHMPLTLKIKKY